jgi:hypothetical protein
MSLDMSPEDDWYRLRRDRADTSTIVYVHLQNLDILDGDNRYWGPGIIRGLSRVVDVWNRPWTTLSVFRNNGKIQWTDDDWNPHSLPLDTPLRGLPRHNVLDLVVKHKYNNHVYLIDYQSQRQIFKFCPFEWELRYFTQEIKALTQLSNRGCLLIPPLLGYVFERSEDQIIGFICEELQGRCAEPGDYDQCRDALHKLHPYGCIHGDLNKYNIIMTTNGPHFIDLEKSKLDIDLSNTEFVAEQRRELDRLEAALKDEEGWGKPTPEVGSS